MRRSANAGNGKLLKAFSISLTFADSHTERPKLDQAVANCVPNPTGPRERHRSKMLSARWYRDGSRTGRDVALLAEPFRPHVGFSGWRATCFSEVS